jgi:hypothetical protein
MDKKEQKQFHLDKTLKGFTYNVIGVTLPFLLSLLPIILFGKYHAVVNFLDQGEFLLFSAGLYTTSFFLYEENSTSVVKKTDKILKNLSLWLLVICAALYAIIYCVELFVQFKISVDLIFLRLFSLALFGIAVWSVFRSIYIDYQKLIPNIDVQKKSGSDVEDIMSQLPKEK